MCLFYFRYILDTKTSLQHTKTLLKYERQTTFNLKLQDLVKK